MARIEQGLKQDRTNKIADSEIAPRHRYSNCHVRGTQKCHETNANLIKNRKNWAVVFSAMKQRIEK